jgi:hypothetical protein
MNKTTFINREIVFGTYFLGQWIEASGSDDVQESFTILSKNPFKYIPLFLHTAINSTAEMYGLEKVELFQVIEGVDEGGGIAGEKIQAILKVFTDSMTANVGNEKKGGRKVVGK